MEILLQNETELVKLNNKLLELSTNVNEEYIMKAAIDAATSYITVKRYLNGNAKKEPLAKKLIEFFESSLQVL